MADMTDQVIPPAAIAATTEARYAHRDASGPYGHVKCSCGASFVTGVEQLQHASLSILEAALPHLRPLVEAQELRLATEVALALGRLEMREEIAQAFDREVELIESLPDDEGVRPQVRDVLRARRAAFRDCAQAARDTGKGDSA